MAVSTPSIDPAAMPSAQPAMIRSSDCSTASQKLPLSASSQRRASVTVGEGSRSSDPTARDAMNHINIQKSAAAIFKTAVGTFCVFLFACVVEIITGHCSSD